MKLNKLRYYWSTGTFLGHKDFSSVMVRDRYLGTRACLRLHPYTRYSDDSNKDPLWNSRLLLGHLNQSSVDISTPCGVSSFDVHMVSDCTHVLVGKYVSSHNHGQWERA